LAKRIEDKETSGVLDETFKPAVDELSSQIVDMMEDRKGVATQDRLYKHGFEKLRQINAHDSQVKLEAKVHAMFKKSSLTARGKDGHRGNEINTALYSLHQERMKKL
jgi:hypothetical protein